MAIEMGMPARRTASMPRRVRSKDPGTADQLMAALPAVEAELDLVCSEGAHILPGNQGPVRNEDAAHGEAAGCREELLEMRVQERLASGDQEAQSAVQENCPAILMASARGRSTGRAGPR